MKILSFLIGLVAIFILTISCEKVIKIDLPGNKSVPVIEAYIETDSLCFVRLSSTINIFKQQSQNLITDAAITISDNQGNNETLLYNDRGVYRGVTLRGTIGNTYTLSVTIDGKEYKASSTILPVVPIDSLTFKKDSQLDNSKKVELHYTDPSTAKNSYVARGFYIPDPNSTSSSPTNRSYLLNDDNKNGEPNTVQLFSRKLNSGELIVAELRSIDQAVFDYYFSIEDALTGSSFTSAAPANPKSNFSNGALGYFGAWSKDIKLLIVP